MYIIYQIRPVDFRDSGNERSVVFKFEAVHLSDDYSVKV
jgi:hypothetical protein